MSIATRILDLATGGGFSRAFANPRPGASDEDIMNFYRGRYNLYATPEALRDVERGVKAKIEAPSTLIYPTLDELRDRALRARGLRYDQTFDEIPEKSPTGRILREIINLPATGEYSGA